MSHTSVQERSDTASTEAVRLTVVREPVSRGNSHAHNGQRHEHGHEPSELASRPSHYTMHIPATPMTFVFVRQRMASGLRSLAAGLVGTGIGAFLATQISSTPNLRVQIAIVSAICVLLGLLMFHYAVRDLFGRLRIDARGIQLSPGYQGFAIAWTDLTRWGVDGMAFRFSSLKSKSILTTDLDTLTPEDRKALRDLLVACAPNKETRAMASSTS